MRSLFELSGLPQSQWKSKSLKCGSTDLDVFTRLSEIDMLGFVENGNNIYLYSEICGNGKTSWAIKLMYNYFDQIWHKSGFDCKALFISVPRFLYDCKRSISQQVLDYERQCSLIPEVDLVIWDDISCADFTSFEYQIIFQYIDGRLNSGLSNIYTGNRNQSECESILGSRLVSRIFGYSELIEFKEEDKRGKTNG
jgi:DNA replication protein DnaC